MSPEQAAAEHAMRLALDQAQNAWLIGEVPVGAVIVRRTPNGPQVVATGYNRPITTHDPTAHAEIVALRHAAQLLENYRLPDCELYVTLEPCPMCAMATMHEARPRDETTPSPPIIPTQKIEKIRWYAHSTRITLRSASSPTTGEW